MLDGSGVYPRVCGGTITRRSSSLALCGLSPRVRGNRKRLLHHPSNRGSIPACAGEPKSATTAPPTTRVYPRVCGGTLRRERLRLRQGGLSPRVRGNRFISGVGEVLWGSIPACAGEPRWATTDARAKRVYPRVCGGTKPAMVNTDAVVGLSPRVRGNPKMELGSISPFRSIPACAGEPPVATPQLGAGQVYPRVCGGTGRCRNPSCAAPGLSPRVRGNRSASSLAPTGIRSIPACAGEPAGVARRHSARWVYPRVCGGTPPARQHGARK